MTGLHTKLHPSVKVALGALLGVTLAMNAPTAASAAVIGFVANPTSNYSGWSTAVTGLGGQINGALNFNAMTNGALNGGFYSAAQGVTMSQTGNITVASSLLSNGFSVGPNASPGEGAWTPSKLLVAESAALSNTPMQSLTFLFNESVLGGGIFLVDYAGFTRWTITAKDANNVVLGSFTSVQNGFQQQGTGSSPTGPFKYFMGIESTAGDIASITISRPATGIGQGGDRVGLDDFRFAKVAPPQAVPEPATTAILGSGLLGLGLLRRRRRSAENQRH